MIDPLTEKQMEAQLAWLALMRAYQSLARAARLGEISDERRGEIEAEALTQIGKVLEAQSEFSFPIERPLEAAKKEIGGFFARVRASGLS